MIRDQLAGKSPKVAVLCGPEQLFGNEDRWITDMGAWFPGERVVLRGEDLFHDLGRLGWMEPLLCAITGRSLKDRFSFFRASGR